MNNFSKWCGAVALLAGSSLVQASQINVGGVTWDPDNPDDYFSTDTMYQTPASFTGTAATGTANLYDFTGTSEISGYGNITSLNGALQNVFCPGCELTYQFGGYQLNQWFDVDGNGTVNSGDYVSFSGGWLNAYVDKTPDFNNLTADSAGDEGGANALWLSLAATTQTAELAGQAMTGTLFASIQTGSLGTGNEGGNGFGSFDVTGGLAEGNFDTNTAAAGSDLNFTSSYQPRNCSPGCPEGFELFGSNDISGDSIPEPGSLLLFGLGLLGLGARRKLRS